MTVVRILHSATAGHVPSSLAEGQIAINEADGLLFFRNAAGNVVSIPLAGGNFASNCRLQYISTTQSRLVPFNGNSLFINGRIETIPDAGVNLANTGLTQATRYYVYAYMNGTTMTLEASATAPTTAWGGFKIKTGDATRTLVGMIYMNTGSPGLFKDGWVLSWFNRIRKMLTLTGGQVTLTGNGTAHEISSTYRLGFICWADDAPIGTLACLGWNEAGTSTFGDVNFRIDSAGSQNGPVRYQTSVTASGITAYLQCGWDGAWVFPPQTEGYHYLTLLGNAAASTSFAVWNPVIGISVMG